MDIASLVMKIASGRNWVGEILSYCMHVRKRKKEKERKREREKERERKEREREKESERMKGERK